MTRDGFMEMFVRPTSLAGKATIEFVVALVVFTKHMHVRTHIDLFASATRKTLPTWPPSSDELFIHLILLLICIVLSMYNSIGLWTVSCSPELECFPCHACLQHNCDHTKLREVMWVQRWLIGTRFYHNAYESEEFSLCSTQDSVSQYQ